MVILRRIYGKHRNSRRTYAIRARGTDPAHHHPIQTVTRRQYGQFAGHHRQYFQEYAEQLADGIGAIDRNATWPLSCIDWQKAAEELQQDYTSVDYGGVTYWLRS